MTSNQVLSDKVLEIRKLIQEKIPIGAIVPEHTADEHFYRCNLFEGRPLYDSVTTKTGILGEGYLKTWAVNVALKYVEDNEGRLEEDLYTVIDEAKNKHKEIFEEAGELGTDVHIAIERYINDWIKTGEQPENIRNYLRDQYCDPRVLFGVLAAEKFFRDNMIVPIYSELLVASRHMKVAGTLDFLALVGTVIKPAKKSGKEDFYQIKLKAQDGIYFECANTGKQVKYQLAIIDWKTSNYIDKPAYVLQIATYRKCLRELTGLITYVNKIVRLDKKTAKYEVADVPMTQADKAAKVYKTGVGMVYDFLKSEDSKLK